MDQAMKNILIIGKHYFQESVSETINKVVELLHSLQVTTFVGSHTAQHYTIPNSTIINADEVREYQIQLAIICGGDGTILKSARYLCGKGVPIVGINNGRLGFLTDISLANMEEELRCLIQNQGRLEERFFLKGKIVCNHETICEDISLNDIYLNKNQSGRLAEFELIIDGQHAYNIRSDGIIISTPTGSTGYSLSAGSNVIHPSSHCIGITPLNPHSLFVRPMIINDKSQILIRTKMPGVHIHFDGQKNIELSEDKEYLISICKHHETITFLHPHQYNYFQSLKEKFS